jgi:hypothetical protein
VHLGALLECEDAQSLEHRRLQIDRNRVRRLLEARRPGRRKWWLVCPGAPMSRDTGIVAGWRPKNAGIITF